MPAERRHRLQHQSSNPSAGLRFPGFRHFWQAYQWQVILSLLLVSLILGYIGFWKYTRAIGASHSATDLLYKTIQLTTLESGAVSGPVSWELEVARFLVPVLTASTAILAAAVLFRKQLQMIRLRFLRDHVIVCGLGDKGARLASALRRRGYDVVAIEPDESNPSIDFCREIGVIVLEGDATDPTLLRKTAVQRASHLVSLCGVDGVNAEIAMLSRQLTANRKQGALHCSIHLVNPDLCELLREHEFGSQAFPNFRLEMFNIYELGARALIRDFPPCEPGSGTNPAGSHILVVGPGKLGESLVIQSARAWYEQTRGDDGLLRITLVGRDAEVLANWLYKHYPKISCCCELIPYPIDLSSYEFSEAGFLFNPQGTCDIDRIYICPDDQTLSLPAALKLRQRLECDQPLIVVRMDEDSGLAKLLTGQMAAAGNSRNIVPFGLSQRVNLADLVLGGTFEILAQAIHADYLQRRLAEGLNSGKNVLWCPGISCRKTCANPTAGRLTTFV